MSCTTAAITGVLLQFALWSLSILASEASYPPDFTNVTLEVLGIKPVEPRKDPKTSFVVGGKNATVLIETLEEINGRTIAELERDMRPGAPVKAGSDKGFLGAEERLLDVLIADNETVVKRLKLTHQTVATHLLAVAAIGEKLKGTPFLYHGRPFKVTVRRFRGFQFSPFQDDTETNAEATVENLDSGHKLEYSLLAPQMIERYGFYEGKGTPYRVDPERVVEVFDFLSENKPYRSPTRQDTPVGIAKPASPSIVARSTSPSWGLRCD